MIKIKSRKTIGTPLSPVSCQLSVVSCSRTRGALLLELLIAISILAVVLSVGSQAVFVSLQSGKTSGESDVAIGLANEALEAVRGTAEEKWQNIYTLTKWTQHYYPAPSAGKWTLAAGDEAIALNTANYTRYVTIQNVCRDTTPTSRAITGITDTDGTLTTCTTSTGLFDPSTQKVTVTVSWQGSGSPVTVSDYFLRWRNKVCPQTSWAGGVSSGVKTCPDTTYESATDITAGAGLQITP
ncbi:MAG: hypothetical protein AAB497_03385 [Patescibacteria group bacterium]|mgnify:CR=1 FL=1